MKVKSVRGFTLVELMVVFAILAILVAVGPSALERMRDSMQYRDTLRGVISDLRNARQRSISDGRNIRFVLDVARKTYGIQGEHHHDVPGNIQVRADVADIEIAPNGIAGITFLPNGGATGGTITIARPSGAGAKLRVDWLTGRITQLPVLP